jgi:hypothetical protein
MSTDFIFSEKINACDLFDGRLEKFGVREDISVDKTSEKARCITDGRNYLWVWINDAGVVSGFTRYGLANMPGKILKAIAEVFETDIFSEHEPQYWGFDTQGEWDAAMEQLAKKERERFYSEIVKYLRGEPHDILPSTVGMAKAEIAKKLVDENPELLSPENKNQLMSKMESHYLRDEVVIIPSRSEMAEMMGDHEDDLPLF